MKSKNIVRCYWAIVMAAVLLSGCSGKTFSAEKLFWRARRDAARAAGDTPVKAFSGEQAGRVIAAYQTVVDRFPLEPLSARAQFMIADIYAVRGDYEKARESLKRIVENFSFQPQIAARAQFAFARTFEQEKDSARAIREYEKIYDLYPLTDAGLRAPIYIIEYCDRIKDNAARRRAHRQAVRHYRGIIGDYADTSVAAVVQNYLAQAYLMGGDWNGAMQVWDEIIMQHPNTPQAVRGMLAKAELRAKEFNDLPGAIGIYKQCLSDHPAAKFTPEIKLRLAGLYLDNGQEEQAQEIFTQLIKSGSSDENLTVRARMGLIACMKKTGDTGRVAGGYDDIGQDYPDHPIGIMAPYLVYNYYKQTGDAEQARVSLEKAVAGYRQRLSAEKNDKENSMVARMLFLCYTQQHEWKKALDLLESLAARYPKDPAYLFSAAMVYRKELGDLSGARAVYLKMIDRFRGNKALTRLIDAQIASLDAEAGKNDGRK